MWKRSGRGRVELLRETTGVISKLKLPRTATTSWRDFLRPGSKTVRADCTYTRVHTIYVSEGNQSKTPFSLTPRTSVSLPMFVFETPVSRGTTFTDDTQKLQDGLKRLGVRRKPLYSYSGAGVSQPPSSLGTHFTVPSQVLCLRVGYHHPRHGGYPEESGLRATSRPSHPP